MTAIYEYGPETDFYKGRKNALEDESLHDELERLKPLAELGRMTATVAHEVRNPLAGISANAELLREVLDDPADQVCIDVILGEVDRLSNLVTDLMLYTREREPTVGPLDLAELARQTIDMCRSDAEQAQVELETSGEAVVRGDSDLSRQALLNIIRNAIQATSPGGRVRLEVEEPCITVIDEGHGIPQALRDDIFTPFVTGRTRGLGLGAAVARRCLRRQGGEIALRSTSESGTSFRLSWCLDGME